MEELVHRAVQDQSDKAVQPHTPGPWTIEHGEQNRLIIDPEGDIIAEVHWWVFENAAASEANARLIAAAPDHALICWAMCVQDARWEEWADGKGEFCFAGLRHSTSLDEFGAPVLTPHLRGLLVAAKAAQ